jgi:hypothetical protein
VIWRNGRQLLNFLEAVRPGFHATKMNNQDLRDEKVAQANGGHADVGGEQLRNINGEQQGDQNMNQDDQEKTPRKEAKRGRE